MALPLSSKRQKVQWTFNAQRWDHHGVPEWAPVAQLCSTMSQKNRDLSGTAATTVTTTPVYRHVWTQEFDGFYCT